MEQVATVAVPAKLAPRKAICLSCRRLLMEGERCDVDPAHGWVALSDEVQTLKTLEDERHAPSRQIALILLGTAAALAAAVTTSPKRESVTVAVVIYAVFLLSWFGFRRFRPSRGIDRMTASGKDRRVGEPMEGVADGPGTAAGPISNDSCLAYSIEFRVAGAPPERPVALVDEVTGGFDLRLDDGRLIRIPPGRVYLDASAQTDRAVTQRVVPGSAGDQYLGSIDRSLAGQSELLAADLVKEVALRSGDRVRFWGPLVRLEDERANLRDAAVVVYAPKEVPILEILPPKSG